MSPAVGWIAGALALLLLGGGRARAVVRGRHAGRRGGAPRPMNSRAAGPLAVGALAIACVVAGGLPGGLLAAAICCPGAALVLRYAHRRPASSAPDPALPVTLDLAAAVLRGGRPLPDALSLAAPAARADVAEQLRRIAGLLRLGADPAQAWQSAVGSRDAPLHAVAAAAVRSASSGVKVAGAFTDLAEQLRAERGALLAVRASRAGVAAMAPLAACYLPSFVCLGVVPAVVGIATTTIGVLP